MSNNIVEDVLLLPAIAAGVVATVVTTAIGGVKYDEVRNSLVSYYSICY